MMAEERDFDVFVSHASEDKDNVVRSLEQAYRYMGRRAVD